MSTRLIRNSALALVAALVIVLNQAFSSSATSSLTFAVSLIVLTLADVARLDRVVAVITGAAADTESGRSRPNRRRS